MERLLYGFFARFLEGKGGIMTALGDVIPVLYI